MASEIIQEISHFNIPQQQALIINANTVVALIARAGGKDHGFVTPIQLRNAKGMPRGATAFIVPTYIKAKNDMIPALVKALEHFHYYEDIDFWVGTFIPASVKHEKAYEHPRDPQYSIFWRNGHVTRIIGLDNKKTANGQSNDYIILNEGKFIKYEDFISRVKPTNRGNEDIPAFTRLHYHHGMLIASDRPDVSNGHWMMDYERKMDKEQIDLIVTFDKDHRDYLKQVTKDLMAIDPKLPATIEYDREQLIATMRDLVLKQQLTVAVETRIRKEICRLEDILFTLRRKAVHFVTASTLDNIDVVGADFIDEMFRDLNEKVFNRAILNIEDDSPDSMFYSTFSEELHTYDDINYDYVELFPNSDLPQPWKKDGDIDTKRPLHIACDWNRDITCMEVGQEFNTCFRFLNSLAVLDPDRIKHLAKKFSDYYIGFPFKKVIHHYDHTATGQDSSKEIGFATELKIELTALGWTVEEHYIGRTQNQSLRNKMFKRVYAEDDINTKAIRINRTNCKTPLQIGQGYGGLIPSLINCGAYETTNAKGQSITKKDKAPERIKTYPPEQAPHHSDAHDTMYIGVFHDRLGDTQDESDFVS